MIELMQRAYDDQRNLLAALQDGGRELSVKAERQASGWPADPEARKLEMARRQKVAAKKRGSHLHPRDPRHPEHEEWLKKMRRGKKRQWASLTAAEKKTRLDHMAAARREKAA